jgi:hemerythrin superfamily protein
MAKSRRTVRRPARKRSRSSRSTAANDAIALLKKDHQQVEHWFEEFLSARAGSRKQDLAQRICQALKVHTEIEHEIFYPAFLEATGEEDVHHEAEVEHEGAKKLIAEIEQFGPQDEYFDARVKVLSEMIKHHVNEEEKRDGMFAQARQSRMDLQSLGRQLADRKAQLMGGEAAALEEERPNRGSHAAQGRSRQDSRSTARQQ